MSGVATAIAGSAILGAVVSSNAAGKAASAQENAANQADATQRYQYDTTRADNAPFRESGVAANNRLSYLLGLSSTGGPTSGNSLAGQRLVDTSSGVPQYNVELYGNNSAYRDAWDEIAKGHYGAYGKDYNQFSDSNDIERALRSRLQNQLTQDNQALQNDSAHGSLLRNFSADDLNADPVYQSGLQFGLDEGTKGINRMAAASGNSLSGATLKALTRFGNDYGSTKANESFNRFNVNRDSTYNKLAGLSGAGQQSTNQVSAAGQNMANNVSQNQIGVGNARAASAIGQANGINNSLSQGYNMYQQTQLMNNLFPKSYGVAQQPGVTGWNSQG